MLSYTYIQCAQPRGRAELLVLLSRDTVHRDRLMACSSLCMPPHQALRIQRHLPEYPEMENEKTSMPIHVAWIHRSAFYHNVRWAVDPDTYPVSSGYWIGNATGNE